MLKLECFTNLILLNLFCCREHKKAVFRFGHSETLLPLLSLLGLFKDHESLRADNYHTQQDRLFRTSLIAPFSSNIFFVLYACNNSTETHDDGAFESVTKKEDFNEYKIQFLFKEKPLDIPACGHSVCSYSDVRRHYSTFIDDCRFNEICSLNNHGEL